MERIISALIIAVGLINVFPVVGVFSADILAEAYGISTPSGDLLILMRHRALLFGIVGGIVLISAFRRHLQPTAMLAALVSMTGFVGLTLASGVYGQKLYNVMVIDGIGLVLLVAAVVLRFRRSRDET